jgi:hypothetical protein
MQTEINDANKFVETANREPLGILFTLLTISIPHPGLIKRDNNWDNG